MSGKTDNVWAMPKTRMTREPCGNVTERRLITGVPHGRRMGAGGGA